MWDKIKTRILYKILEPILNFIKEYIMRTSYVHRGKKCRLHVGKNVVLMNTCFNAASGDIYIGDYTIFGHNCSVITGKHEFVNGMRKKLVTGGPEAPTEGRDVRIGRGCFIGSNALISGNVTIGDNVIVAAGSVVVSDIKSGYFVAGVPAREKHLVK